MLKYTVLSFSIFFICLTAICQEMNNPYILESEWQGYSIGDPYVLKHRGVFYLYCSTKDSETGIKTWSSDDLISWKYEGLSSTDIITKGAYAPEVFYWNGTFYMYTSPAGNGHYVLSAPSPTGPFTAVTGNFGKSIDGSVFIEDDGSWYFYHASPSGIIGCPMADPTIIGTGINLGTVMNNDWTEGPCVFKRNGIYYMIYTGNHVISKGYRIDYATNTTGPLNTFSPASFQNPVLVRTLGLHTGLGHGSIFIGPDLDSYYLTYHNLVSGNGPFRRLNFDRIAWNAEQMVVLGPTDYAQQNPSPPDAYDYFRRDEPDAPWSFPLGGEWSIANHGSLQQYNMNQDPEDIYLALLDSVSDKNYTAEYNFRELERVDDNSKIGAVFGYTDSSNYGIALINGASKKLEINFINDNIWKSPEFTDLPVNLDFSQWHTLRIEKFNSKFRFFIDGLFQYEVENELHGGKIGYVTSRAKGEFGYIAFSNKVNGSGTFDIFKPVPGKLPAMQYNQGGEGIGYHKADIPEQLEGAVRADEIPLTQYEHGGMAVSSLATNEWLSYNINTELTRLYNVQLIYRANASGCAVRLFHNGTDVTSVIDLPSTEGDWKTFLIKNIALNQGFGTIRLQVESGPIDLYEMEFVKAVNEPFDESVKFSGSFGPGWRYNDGDWSVTSEYALIDGYGKRAYGSEYWRDYSVETDIMFTRSMNAGLIFRVNNPALGGAGNDPARGTDYLQGYFCGFNFSSVVLGKHNFGWQLLESASIPMEMNRWYRLRVVVNDDRIRVYVDDMTEPKIDYTDPYPLINGMAGYRSFNTGVRFDNFRVTSELLTTSIEEMPATATNEILIFPNPSSDYVTLRFSDSVKRQIRISGLSGRILFSTDSMKDELKLPVKTLPSGIYLIHVESNSEVATQKLIVH
jgi:xylan 1,4-beta-xylosidase